MRAEDLSIALRPRSGWAAIELGFALARRHYGRVLAAWLLASLPVLAVVLAVCALLDLLWLAPLLMWWLKPAFERIVLQIYAGAVFARPPGVREAVLGQRRLGLRGLPGWLTWRRLSPLRSMLMPVDLLEGLRGRARGKRCNVLARRDSGPAAVLLLVLLHIEAILLFSVIGLVVLLVPIDFMGAAAELMWDTLFEEPPAWAQVLLAVLGWACSSAIAPFYVGGGFALYLNRRIHLEAWDLELAFRRMAARVAPVATRLAAVPALAVLVVALSLLPAAPAQAVEPMGCPPPGAAGDPGAGTGGKTRKGGDHLWPARLRDPEAPRPTDGFGRVFGEDDGQADAFVVLAAQTLADEFTPTRTQTTWLPRDRDDDGDSARRTSDAMAAVGRVFAFIAEHILWIALGIVLVLVAVMLVRWRPRMGLPGVPRAAWRQRFGVDRDTEAALPDDLVGEARGLWAAGQPRAALALLYAGAVAVLVERSGRPLPAGSTEAQCLRHARSLGDPGFRRGFEPIVRHWQAIAYAHRVPGDAAFEALVEAYERLRQPADADPAGVPA